MILNMAVKVLSTGKQTNKQNAQFKSCELSLFSVLLRDYIPGDSLLDSSDRMFCRGGRGGREFNMYVILAEGTSDQAHILVEGCC